MGTFPLRPGLWLFWLTMVLLYTLTVGPQLPFQRSAPADVGRRPPAFTEVYSYADGLEVEVTDVWQGRRLGMPVVDLTVVVHNGSAHTFEAWLSGELRYGSHRQLAVRYLTPPGPDDLASVQLIALGATSDPYRMTFLVPPSARGDLRLAVSIDAGAHDPAVFTGAV